MLRNSDLDQIELPSSFTKRSIYERFCYERGSVAKSNSDGSYLPIDKYEKRPFDDDENGLNLFPEGSDRLDVCHWSTFLRTWNKHISHLKVRSPSDNTCVQCNIYRNLSKYSMNDSDRVGDAEGGLDVSNLRCPETNEPSLLKPLVDEVEESHENLILNAAKHVKTAQSQKLLAQEKIKLAKDRYDSERSESSVITLVMDYCQNMGIPHFGNEQPGDTYYYSPIWLYCFGIVNVALDQLYAYIYQESAGKKGSMNVVSFLLHYIENYVMGNGHHNYQTKDELNIITDNCGGQNKNGLILKAAAYLMEKNWFRRVTLIFLIRGHTKNSADRMFNLLKVHWRQTNVYTYQQALDILGECEYVNVVDSTHLHVDYSQLLEKIYRQPVSGSIQKNHVFSFDAKLKEHVEMSSKVTNKALVTTTQVLKKKVKNLTEFHRQYLIRCWKPKSLDPVGLKPIKQVHLYTKWRKVVPRQYRDITCLLPPNNIIRKHFKKGDDEDDDFLAPVPAMGATPKNDSAPTDIPDVTNNDNITPPDLTK